MPFVFDDGRFSRCPTSIDHAMEIKHRVYDDEIKCTSCKTSSTKYTQTSKCVLCARLDAITFHAFHNKYDYVWTDSDGVHYAQPMGDLSGKAEPSIISDSKWSEMTELSELARTDTVFSVAPDPCKPLGHVGLRRLGKCYLCLTEKNKLSPRQDAMSKGEKWYTPSKPCSKCDQTALKRVDNGTCSGCMPLILPDAPDNRETADSILMRQEPDMIIERDLADELGMKVYRTGKECKHGHKGWKYVSTRNCIPCLRGRS